MTEENFYELWERFTASTLIESLPENVEKFCEEKEITIDYFLMEFM